MGHGFHIAETCTGDVSAVMAPSFWPTSGWSTCGRPDGQCDPWNDGHVCNEKYPNIPFRLVIVAYSTLPRSLGVGLLLVSLTKMVMIICLLGKPWRSYSVISLVKAILKLAATRSGFETTRQSIDINIINIVFRLKAAAILSSKHAWYLLDPGRTEILFILWFLIIGFH